MPNFVRKTKRQHPDKKVEIWFQDEARFGQKGRVVRGWAPRGTRPRQYKQGGFKSAYVFGAVNPKTGESVGIIFPTCNTTIMNIHLQEIGRKVGHVRHAVLVLDQASWHRAKMLKVPNNISLLQLPPYSPELNPVERLWLWMKDHYLSNQVFEDEADLIRKGCRAWKKINKKIIKSVCKTKWIKRQN
jgi:transposase